MSCNDDRGGGGGGNDWSRTSPNPETESWSNPFTDGIPGAGYPIVDQFLRFLSSQIYWLLAKAEAVVIAILAVYLGVALVLLLLFWLDAVRRYHKNVLQSILHSSGSSSQPVLRLSWAVVSLVFAMVLSPVAAILWIIWLPSICWALTVWSLRLMFRLARTQLPNLWRLCLLLAQSPYWLLCKLSLWSPRIGAWTGFGTDSEDAQDQERRERLHQSMLDIEDKILQVHQICDKRSKKPTKNCKQ